MRRTDYSAPASSSKQRECHTALAVTKWTF